MTKPIKASDVVSIKPDQVFEVFNQLILENWDGTQAIVKTKDASKKIAEKMNITIPDVHEKKYLDIEEAYRASGWRVIFDKPGYNETPYASFFLFERETGK